MTPWHIRRRIKEWLHKRYAREISHSKNPSDGLHAGQDNQNLVETSSYMHLEKEHKKWFILGRMGKQRGKPHYAPPNEKKSGKTWKNK